MRRVVAPGPSHPDAVLLRTGAFSGLRSGTTARARWVRAGHGTAGRATMIETAHEC